ncbi:MAG: dienelactone hydrolase family protein, partial [Gammaproteobacteria bacterium]|nr:dienelactone hydrolase family protein [Gammaproteobacteria bacterium]
MTTTDDLAAKMVDGIHAYLDRQLAATREIRRTEWEAENSSIEESTESVIARRDELRRILGVVDDRIDPSLNIDVSHPRGPTEIGRASGYAIYEVRWIVLDGLDAEGLLLRPHARPHAHVVAVPDADTSPEQLTGISVGLTPDAQTARRLAESGCEVLVPDLIDRSDRWSQSVGVAETNQTHREFIYRMAYQIGRHIVGYEIQKILAAVDWFATNRDPSSIGVAGHGEGGLLALYAAAIDDRIAGALVSGYFESREKIWREPLYRNVWKLLTKFGDAELAAMIAPRSLTVKSGGGPEVDGPPPVKDEMRTAAPGRLTNPDEETVNSEAERSASYFRRMGADGRLKFVGHRGSGRSHIEALESLLAGLGVDAGLGRIQADPVTSRAFSGRSMRLKRQFDGLVRQVRAQVRTAENNRQAFYWESRSLESIDAWSDSWKDFRDRLWVDVVGKLPKPVLPPDPRSRLAYKRESWNGYEVTLDLWPDIFAYGTLLVPKDLREGERRPVVVCQHGLEGRTQDVVDKGIESVYNGFGEQLVERGFVVFAPQQPHIF